MNALVWVAALLLVGLVVMVLEVFLPSGGVLGFLSLMALIAAIITAFVEGGSVFGLSVLLVTFLAVPSVLAVAFRWFPDTPLGRRVLPPPPAPEDVVPDGERRRSLRGLIGRVGRTTSELLPWGGVEIDGIACEALSESGPVSAETPVEVVGVQGSALLVRVPAAPLRPQPPDSPPQTPSDASADRPAQPARPKAEEPSPWSKTLEEFDFERLDPPGA
jgi:membrane-bound ClpP family serine protease